MPSLSIHLLSIALCLSSGFQQGYIASVINQPYKQIQQYINDSWVIQFGQPIGPATLDLIWSFLNVCFPIATIFGQLFANIACARLGRKKTAVLATALYIPGTLLCGLSKYLMPAFELLFVGRIIWSFANGLSSVNATIWIVECAPPKIRGRMASQQEVAMALGSLTTQGLGVLFSTDELWPFNFFPNCLIALVNILMFIPIYESPQYIMEKYGDVDMARKALASYHGCLVTDESVDQEMRICEESIEKGKQTSDQKVEKPTIKTEYTSNEIMFMPWRSRDQASQLIRHAAWLGVMVKIGTFVGLALLLLINTCGIGSVSRFYSAELVPRHLLLSSVATLTMFESISKIAVEFAFYPVANVIGAQALLLFIVPTAILTIAMWFWCPETSRKTVNEVLNEMAQRRKLDVSFPM
ncbi:hypothetical protein WR25_03608 [Diploscapter pachys]|uniref:Major facilitator superfamily (MFS) profile domain-containing protein n=1 Tax=Diploscapter pachys TaxID=2018661 RepID=A0A2A2KCD4_9BILA|nr:hypothetical protein WR25_03608 [Diploscapter pachys]